MSNKAELKDWVKALVFGTILSIVLALLYASTFRPRIDVKVKNQTPIEKWGPLGVSFIPIEKRNIRFAYEVSITNVDYADWDVGYREYAGKSLEVVYVYKHGGVSILTNDFTKAVEYFDMKASPRLKFLATRDVPVLPR